MPKAECDFLTWTSFPSSLKYTNELGTHYWRRVFGALPVSPGSTLKVELKARLQDVSDALPAGSGIEFNGWDGVPAGTRRWLFGLSMGVGTLDWRVDTREYKVPSDIKQIEGILRCGAGSAEKLAITWFDDLKILQDGTLIYSNDFSNWDPVIGAGVGAPIGGAIGYFLKEPLGPMVSEAVGAVLGGALGGGVGLLTGLGIIPVPQIPIPSLGAAPEEPGAPMRLGKYQITG